MSNCFNKQFEKEDELKTSVTVCIKKTTAINTDKINIKFINKSIVKK